MNKPNQILIDLRKKNNYSQQFIADELGISRQAYSHYETGRREPDFSTLIKLASIFEVSTDYLLGRDESDNKKSPDKSELNGAFFRLKKGLEPYDLDKDDVDFLLKVYKAHIEKNK